MFIRVDTPEQEIKGYSYVSLTDNLISVALPEGTLSSRDLDLFFIHDNEWDKRLALYVKDIPKLVKALEAAYQHCIPLITVAGNCKN